MCVFVLFKHTAACTSLDAQHQADVHREQLRHEVAEDVRDRDDLDAAAGLAVAAGHLSPRRDGRGRDRDRRNERAAQAAHVRLRVIRVVHQAVLQHERHAVREQRVALHLAKADAASALAALDGLLRQVVHGAGRADLELVRDHVPQALVVHHAQVDVGVKLGARDAAVHGLVAVVVVPRRAQLLTKVVDRAVLLIELERRRILAQRVQRPGLARHALNEHADGHARGERVRVDDHVRHHARLAEGHVDRGPLDAAHALLPVAGREFVANGRLARYSERDRDLLQHLVAAVVADQPHLLHVRRVGTLVALDAADARRLVEHAVQRVAVLKARADKGKSV
eukprot:Unigene7868_Nuclearia_a/m.24167 Unigene7868_Nuclearia_a/g.24167  ORF Unigene7868_Nuclearia_a/g.24167 Unigene7868_Nuclearia_a/m.24167 type:complete len:339 (-) Unigene7868_Nuclearia_a:1067-2083(-)